METMIKAIRSAGLFARNWSFSVSAPVLAIYDEDGEGFIGTVALVDGKWAQSNKGIAAERAALARLCNMANKEAA